MDTLTILDDPLAAPRPAPGLTTDERHRSESDLRDWRTACRTYRARVRAGERLDAEQNEDWMYCLYALNEVALSEMGL